MNTPSGSSFPAHPEQLLAGRRLILVSNREPYSRQVVDGKARLVPAAGGLVTALTPVMRQCGGVWLAWDAEGKQRRAEVPGEGPSFTLRQVPLSAGEVRQYYHGFANRALWPLCHYFVGRCTFDEDNWRAYKAVNERFADALAEEAQPNDILWIHDYHFCLLPEMARVRRPGQTIAYFLHIPFPAEPVFRILPWRKEILTGILGADLVGLHTPQYVKDFLESCANILGAEVDHGACRVLWQGRTIRVAAYPIGIDAESFEAVAALPEVDDECRTIREHLGGVQLIVGVDRLDYSKGLPERLNAVERLFNDHPEHRGKVTFAQIAVPSRTSVKEYTELKRQVDEMVGRINGQFSTHGWSPILYLYRAVERAELVAYYRAADVALVTPLRDGMNLVAKEYIASRTSGGGVLILSELAGAATELGGGAIVVNPFSVNDVAAALHWALSLSVEEQDRRMNGLREHVRRNNVHRWVARILQDALETQGLL